MARVEGETEEPKTPPAVVAWWRGDGNYGRLPPQFVIPSWFPTLVGAMESRAAEQVFTIREEVLYPSPEQRTPTKGHRFFCASMAELKARRRACVVAGRPQHFHEYITGDCRMYYDFDYQLPEGLAVSVLDRVADVVALYINSLGIPRGKVSWMDASNNSKFSQHIVLPGVYFHSNLEAYMWAMRGFMDLVKKTCLPGKILPKLKLLHKVFDMNVWGRNHSMKMLGSTNIGEDRPFRVVPPGAIWRRRGGNPREGAVAVDGESAAEEEGGEEEEEEVGGEGEDEGEGEEGVAGEGDEGEDNIEDYLCTWLGDGEDPITYTKVKVEETEREYRIFCANWKLPAPRSVVHNRLRSRGSAAVRGRKSGTAASRSDIRHVQGLELIARADPVIRRLLFAKFGILARRHKLLAIRICKDFVSFALTSNRTVSHGKQGYLCIVKALGRQEESVNHKKIDQRRILYFFESWEATYRCDFIDECKKYTSDARFKIPVRRNRDFQDLVKDLRARLE